MRSPSRWRWTAVPLVALLVLLGTWVTGGLLTDDFAVARVLTGLFLAVLGLTAVGVGWRWRALAVPVVGTFALVAGSVSGWLVLASTSTTVHEDVVVTPVGPATRSGPTPPAEGGPGPVPGSAAPTAATGPVLLARGSFAAAAHDTTGTAAVIELPDGQRVVTLTDLATDPGPDLRVYLVPAQADGVSGAVDLGALRGNRGSQQYEVPEGAADSLGSVVIWCRTFSVSFGVAPLAAA